MDKVPNPRDIEAEVRRLNDLGHSLIEISQALQITPDEAMTAGAELRTMADAVAWAHSLPPVDAEGERYARQWVSMTTAELAARFDISERSAAMVQDGARSALAELDAERVTQEYMAGVDVILGDTTASAHEKIARFREHNATFDWRGHDRR